MTIIIGCTTGKITGTEWEDNEFKDAITEDSDISKYVGSNKEITNLLSQGYELNIDTSGIGIIARIGKTENIGCCYKPEVIFESIYEAEGCSLKETISTLNKMIRDEQKKKPPIQYTKSYFGHELSRKNGN